MSNDEPKTWLDLVAEIAAETGSEVTDDEATWLLWEVTPFPLGTRQQVADALRRYFDG